MPVTRWQAIRRQLCPGCFEGRVFQSRLTMYERCPVCDLKFEREPGYFVGAMYVSYAMSLPSGVALLFAVWYGTGWSFSLSLLTTMLIYLPFVPVIFRYSRVIWLHLDRSFDPHD
jgi:uncharacterized protein (DUF983 family)